MFELEQEISKWRHRMLAAGIKTPVPLEELESHLRDEIEQQMKSGLSESASFTAAAQKIGQAPALQNEFKKVAAIRQARVYQILSFAVLGVISLIVCGWMLPQIDVFSERMSGLTAVFAMNLLSWGGRWGYRFFPIIPLRSRNALAIAGSLLASFWWGIFFYLVLPRYDFTAEQLAIAVLWGMMTPFGAFLGLMAGLETAARKRIASTGA